jgi:putative FmdB family regulatory protein
VPIYDYICHHCGHRFEVIHGVHAHGPAHCPVCHTGTVRKAFAPPTIHFKGSGWAKKDRGSSRASGGKSEAPGDGEGKEPAKEPAKEAPSPPPAAPAAGTAAAAE